MDILKIAGWATSASIPESPHVGEPISDPLHLPELNSEPAELAVAQRMLCC
jgi:hypothetical protein